ncbi:molybdenum cofactor synthesis domain-containing protein [Acetitomaculum ruminis DSM 5522]|uniref:Molybdenum cofactor synthesis domain-containing protein n=1 Tax=Acetitomaculum ruminis DSM 5522 TaxID=1120918 RepID=A0A1I0VKU4_9FIRM|nr:MOSC domain-containing protein [Acetitomaculum ruminis]SFA76186.1 molybdenum cofactor synthesis domain-containing protein [Acetitomaculum ruminis DSM 5522]
MGTIKAVCISEKKGVEKVNINEAMIIEDFGLENDAHAGKWHRQVSLLSYERREDFKKKGVEVSDGAFGENLLVSGIDFIHLPLGTKFFVGDVELELTQIGKECHKGCAIMQQVGTCIMPTNGVFTKVLKGGKVKVGDEMTYKLPYTVGIITASDKGSRGERVDLSGAKIKEMVEKAGYQVTSMEIVEDDKEKLKAAMTKLADEKIADLILTTGGTGFSMRDVTPEATIEVCDRMAMGIAEAMRAYSMTITKRAMLSRAVSGIRKQSLIVNMPGSPKAVEESLEYILDSLLHGIQILKGDTGECARH